MVRAPDCLIVGGGIIGCTLALRLRQRGLSVTVLERERIGAEASSAAAGILSPQLEVDAPGPLLDLALRARTGYPSFVAELEAASGQSIGFASSGLIALCSSDAAAATLATRAEWQRSLGLRVDTWTSSDLSREEPACAPHRAWYFPDEMQVEPERLMQALGRACVQAGVVFEIAEVRRVVCEREVAIGVELDRQLRTAGAIVVATGSWSSQLAAGGVVVEPVHGQLVELRSGSRPLRHVVVSGGGYIVPRSDGRVVIGATEERTGFAKAVTAQGVESLLARALAICPALAEAKFERAWSGLRPFSPSGRPAIGPTAINRLFVAAGHHRNGILLAPATADLLVPSILGDPPEPLLQAFLPSFALRQDQKAQDER